MHADLERIAADAQMKGEQHFSFTNPTSGGAAQLATSDRKKRQGLNMIQENDDSQMMSGEGEDYDQFPDNINGLDDMIDRQNFQMLMSGNNSYK